MKYGIFSDVHGNIQALDAVFASMDHFQVTKRICLGDIVGYGANPNECIDKIKERSSVVLLGNHDNVALEREIPEYFNQFALKVIEWTRSHLSPSSVEFLQKLDYLREEDDLLYVHASPKSPADWFYVSSLDEAVEAFDFFPQRICFIGHTHCPVIVVKEEGQSFKVLEESKYHIAPGERLLVNSGSVGQPRDRDPRASWCYYDSDANFIEIVRVPYDIRGAQQAMIARNFPDFLIRRLSEGR